MARNPADPTRVFGVRLRASTRALIDELVTNRMTIPGCARRATAADVIREGVELVARKELPGHMPLVGPPILTEPRPMGENDLVVQIHRFIKESWNLRKAGKIEEAVQATRSADALRMELHTGKPHCSCCLKPIGEGNHA